MPLITDTACRPPFWLHNGHVQTAWPVLFRKVPTPSFHRERIETPDGDFLDIDWLRHERSEDATATHRTPHNGSSPRRLAILTHGLEGSSRQGYIVGMAQALFRSGWDVLAWNFRGCSGEQNRLLRSYHSGAVEDLQCVIDHAAASFAMVSSRHHCNQPEYNGRHSKKTNSTAGNSATGEVPLKIALVGFSLGGNLVLKYAGDRSAAHPGLSGAGGSLAISEDNARVEVTHAVGISVPCDLQGSTQRLELKRNRIYMERFLKTLRAKIRDKKLRYPDAIDDSGLDAIRTFREFDDRYTAPLHGFRDAEEYWYKCSCLRNLQHVAIPTLILNASDDPFLSEGCFPASIASSHPLLHLEMPRSGGHVGFALGNGRYFSEERVAAFLNA